MDLINSYFSDLVFTWLEKREGMQPFIIYGAGLDSQMGGKQRYILAFVPVHLAIKNKARLSELPWKCIQTRVLAYSYRLKNQRWVPPKNRENPTFEIVNRDDSYSEYVPLDQELNLELTLLHDPKRKTRLQYNNKITLLGALETFRSVITYNGLPYSHQSVYEPVIQSDISYEYTTPTEVPLH